MMADMDVYRKLGIRPIVNAQTNKTLLGGSTPSPAVRQAMEDANVGWVDMEELFARSGEYIADVLGVEAAYVTSGCFAGQTLSAAACMTGKDPDKIGQLPDTAGMKNEILIQRRYTFSRSYTVTGGKLIEVADEDGCTRDQLERAIGPKTVAIAYAGGAGRRSTSLLSLEEVVGIAHAHNLPVIMDAASQVFPLDYFRRTAQAGDLVCFGAKYIGAPHSTGFVCGKKDLVEAVAENSFIGFQLPRNRARAIGRAMKIDRQEVIGVVAALEAWLSMDHEERLLEYDMRVSAIERAVRGISGVRASVIRDEESHAPSLRVVLDTAVLGKSAEQAAAELYEGDPRILVFSHGDTLDVNVHNLNAQEETLVAERLRNTLTT